MALSSDNIANFHADSAMDETGPKSLRTSSSNNSSGSSGGGDSAPSSPASSTSPRRRSSGALFSNLESLKSATSDDDKFRRASMNDQHRSSGIFSNFFNSIIGRNPK